MERQRSGLVLGYHGCDMQTRDGIVNHKITMRKSENNYDWLGNGYYFWENNEKRALEFANFQKIRGKVETPAVLGVVMDLGYCLDLTDSEFIATLKNAFQIYENRNRLFNRPLPINEGGNDLFFRRLDCAVIEFLHFWRQENGFRPFDSVRGVFQEGGELYPNAGFREKTHTQICVRNPACFQGYFFN